MNIVVSLIIVVGLFCVGFLGAVPGVEFVFAVAIPYVAVAICTGGMLGRVWSWANVPVPFRIPTTCGQQKSLPWIKQAKFDNPHNRCTVIGRMIFEVLFFRSLMRNTKTKLVDGDRLVHTTEIVLWAAALAFHWSLLVILIRHLRFFLEPVPACLTFLNQLDGFLEMGVPVFYVSTVVFLAALAMLLLRRLASAQLRYISLLEDYLLVFMLLAIGLSGLCLRHFDKTDVAGIKELAVSVVSFQPAIPEGISPLFYGHLFLVCVLLAYLPFSKLVHIAGALLSPTRCMANSNRAVRHVNPWNYPVKVHPYSEYEDELRDKMKAAGVPVEKE